MNGSVGPKLWELEPQRVKESMRTQPQQVNEMLRLELWGVKCPVPVFPFIYRGPFKMVFFKMAAANRCIVLLTKFLLASFADFLLIVLLINLDIQLKSRGKERIRINDRK